MYWERLLPSTLMRWLAGADWPVSEVLVVRTWSFIPHKAAAPVPPALPTHSGVALVGVTTALTIIKVTPQLMVGAAFHHLRHVLGLLVDRHGPDDGAWWRRAGHLDLDGTCLGNLTVKLLQQRGVLEQKTDLC